MGQRGKGGQTTDYTGIFKKDALQQYMQRLELDPGNKKVLELVADLSKHESASAEEIHQLIESGEIEGTEQELYLQTYLQKQKAASLFLDNENIEEASAKAQKANPDSTAAEYLRTTSQILQETGSTSVEDMEELQAVAYTLGEDQVASEIGASIAQIQGQSPPTPQELQESTVLNPGTPPGSPTTITAPPSSAQQPPFDLSALSLTTAQGGDDEPEPQSVVQNVPGQHAAPLSTVLSQENLIEQQKKMDEIRAEIRAQGDKQETSRGNQTRAITAAVMQVNDNLKGTRKLLDDNPEAAQREADTIMRLEERYPKTAKLFERGLISTDQMEDSEFVDAMEKSLNLREEREGNIKSRSIRQTQPQMYARTVPRPGGVYQYRRPHFSTSPMFETTGISKPRSGAR
eukprot:COSAG05_NODE_248_length_12946_cov_85.003737_8_plen_403_part_00